MPPRSRLSLFLRLLFAFVVVSAALPVSAETFRNPRRLPLTVDPYGVTTGDLNGDGINDLVWTELPAYPGTPLLHILLGSPGGQYTSAPNLSLPFYPTFIQCVVEDVTGDKRNDLVCAAASNDYTDAYLFTYGGNGDGTFGAPLQTKIVSPLLFSNPILANAGDLNGDGLPDLILMQSYDSRVLPFLSDGKGGFRPTASFSGSFNSSIPTVADLNGDGKLDVLWPTGPRVNLGNGDGTFSAPVPYDPGYLSNCAFGDVDHDGHLDAACTWYDSGDLDGYIHLTVLHGNADGSFSKTPLFTRTFGNGENEDVGLATILSPVLIADLNGDGYADIVSLSGDGYSILTGGPNTTWNGVSEQFVSASFRSQFGLLAFYGATIADMNGDGLPDIVAVGPNGLYITYAQPDGTLSSAPAYEVGQVSSAATLADFNGDGNLDVVSVGDVALKLSPGRGDGTFSLPQPVSTVQNFSTANYNAPRVISGDFNGDGKQDLLATGGTAPYQSQNYILFGHGDGTFTTPAPVSTFLGGVADLNSDGRSDVFTIQNNAVSANLLVVNLSRGDGTFTSVSTTLPVEITSSGFYAITSGPALADFRHSSHLDAAVATASNVYLLPGNDDGSFAASGTPLPVPGLGSLTGYGTADIVSGDFDHDGNSDIALLAQYGGAASFLSLPTSAVWVYYGRGDGTFSSPVLAGTFNRDAQHLRAGDLNGDGLADLVLTSYDGYQENGVLIVHSLPNRSWGPETDYTGGEGLSPLWITDINHDGRNDLVFSNAGRANESSNSVSVLLNQPAATVSGTVSASPEPSNVTFPFALTASLIPSNAGDSLTGSVTFSLDGAVVGTAPLRGNIATLSGIGATTTAGSHTLSASWDGSTTYPAITLSGTHQVTLLPLSLSLAAMPGSVTIGSPVTATTTFTPGIVPNQPTYQFPGKLTLYDNGTAIAQQQVSSAGFSFSLLSLAAGTHMLSTAYAGDAIFSPAQSNPVTVIVAGAESTAILTATPANTTYGNPVTLTANVAAATPSGATAPTGTVTFVVDGKSMSPAALGNGLATTLLSNLATGTHTATCTYSGDSRYATAACNTVSINITAASSALTLNGSPNPAYALAPVSFTAALVSGTTPIAGQTLVFTLDGAALGSATTSSAGTAAVTSPELQTGPHTVAVNFVGAGSYQTASATLTEQVNPNPTATTLTPSPNPVNQGAALTLNITTNATTGVAPPTGAVTLYDGTAVLGTLPLVAGAGTLSTASTSLTSLTVGQHSLTAVYTPAGTAFLGSQSVAVTITVNPSGLTSSTDPQTVTLQTGHHTNVAVTLTSVGTLAGSYQVTCGSFPALVSCIWGGTNTVTLTPGSTEGLTLTIDTDAVIDYGPYQPQRASLTAPRSHRAPLAAFAALLPVGLLTLRRRPRSRLRLLTLMLAAVVFSSCTACSGRYPDSTPPGTYTLPLAVKSLTGTPVTQTINLRLVVTPAS